MSFIDGATSEVVLCEQDGPVAIITLNRPEAMNTISEELEAALHDALGRAEADPSVRAIVLTGAGDRGFCAGYDMTSKPEMPTAGERLRFWWNIDQQTPGHHWHLLSLEKPVIAAVFGWCLAGGFWYSLASDITIAADDAVFGQPEVREASNSTALLSFLVGWKNALRYTLTGDHFDAQEALRIGAVNEVVPRAELMERAIGLAQRIAMVPADALRINKRITVFALEAMGMRTALDGAAFLSTIAHAASRDAPELQEMFETRRTEGTAASLKLRDNKFRPEPGGPRAKPRADKTA
ncbi:MAG TPA: enoyl-CoA hydratase/isomerase family protein [Conexibacter sp.]|nr:enoyl-CoA hydratase/isomerase family protein [Conexibacter sp.]